MLLWKCLFADTIFFAVTWGVRSKLYNGGESIYFHFVLVVSYNNYKNSQSWERFDNQKIRRLLTFPVEISTCLYNQCQTKPTNRIWNCIVLLPHPVQSHLLSAGFKSQRTSAVWRGPDEEACWSCQRRFLKPQAEFQPYGAGLSINLLLTLQYLIL